MTFYFTDLTLDFLNQATQAWVESGPAKLKGSTASAVVFGLRAGAAFGVGRGASFSEGRARSSRQPGATLRPDTGSCAERWSAP